MRLQLVPLCHRECRVVSWFPNRIIIFYFHISHTKNSTSARFSFGKWKFISKLCKGVNQHADEKSNKSYNFSYFFLPPMSQSRKSFKCLVGGSSWMSLTLRRWERSVEEKSIFSVMKNEFHPWDVYLLLIVDIVKIFFYSEIISVILLKIFKSSTLSSEYNRNLERLYSRSNGNWFSVFHCGVFISFSWFFSSFSFDIENPFV